MKFGLTMIVGLLFIIMPLFLFIPETLLDLKTFTTGKLAKVKIIEIPTNCKSKRKFGKFSYKDFLFSKQIDKEFCENYNNGDSIYMLYNADYPTRFVFPGSSDGFYIDMVSSILLSLLGLVFVIKSKKISKRISSYPFNSILMKRIWW